MALLVRLSFCAALSPYFTNSVHPATVHLQYMKVKVSHLALYSSLLDWNSEELILFFSQRMMKKCLMGECIDCWNRGDVLTLAFCSFLLQHNYVQVFWWLLVGIIIFDYSLQRNMVCEPVSPGNVNRAPGVDITQSQNSSVKLECRHVGRRNDTWLINL